MQVAWRRYALAWICAAGAFVAQGATALTYTEVDSLVVPTNATMMMYSPSMEVLVLKNQASAVYAIDTETQQLLTTRFAVFRFSDMSLAPSGRYVFVADYGGENIGYGTPAHGHLVHRLDLSTAKWDVRAAYIAGNIQATSDTRVVLKSLDQMDDVHE
jgi:hypothetical protein